MRIAIYTHNLKDLGGIERVVREHLRIFSDKGAKCLVFGETGCEHNVPGSGVSRREQVRELLRSFRADYCILHGVAHPGADDDIAVCKSLSIPVIVVCHFSFPSAMLFDGDEGANRRFLEKAQTCDMVAAVSSIDVAWWRSLGCRTMYCQNPFVRFALGSGERGGKSFETELLWVGRNCVQKRPDLALAVLAEIVRSEPNVHLTMVGGSESGWRGLRKRAAKSGLADKLTCLGQRDDLNDLWARADIHLLTSTTECSPLVVAEAKSRGIPTVMFDIPFLDVNKGGKGFLCAKQGDVVGLANQVLRLVRDKPLCRQMGCDARTSLAPFNDDAVWRTWMDIFEALSSGIGGREVEPTLKLIVSQEHFAWNRFCEKNLWAVQMTRDVAKLTGGVITMRQVAKLLRWMVAVIQKTRAALRGR